MSIIGGTMSILGGTMSIGKDVCVFSRDLQILLTKLYGLPLSFRISLVFKKLGCGNIESLASSMLVIDRTVIHEFIMGSILCGNIPPESIIHCFEIIVWMLHHHGTHPTCLYLWNHEHCWCNHEHC